MYWSDICNICSVDYPYTTETSRCRHSLRKQFIAAWATRAKWCKSCSQFSKHHEKHFTHTAATVVMDDEDYHKWYNLASTKNLTEAEMQVYMDSPLVPDSGPDLIIQKFCERQKMGDAFVLKNVDELKDYIGTILENQKAVLSTEHRNVLQFNWDHCTVNSIHYWLNISLTERLPESKMQSYLTTYRENYTKSRWYATHYKNQDTEILKNFLVHQIFSEEFILLNICTFYNLIDANVLHAQKENFSEEFLVELENTCAEMLTVEELLFTSMEDTLEKRASIPLLEENLFVNIEQEDLLN